MRGIGTTGRWVLFGLPLFVMTLQLIGSKNEREAGLTIIAMSVWVLLAVGARWVIEYSNYG